MLRYRSLPTQEIYTCVYSVIAATMPCNVLGTKLFVTLRGPGHMIIGTIANNGNHKFRTQDIQKHYRNTN